MKRVQSILIYFLLLLIFGGFVGALAKNQATSQKTTPTAKEDTTKIHYPVAKTYPTTMKELDEKHPVDLPTPKNVNTVVDYDPVTRNYVIRTKVGDTEVTTPMLLTQDEYMDYSFSKSIRNYYHQKNAEESEKRGSALNFLDVKIGLGPADKLFGPGGIQIRTQGSAEIGMGFKMNNIQNPTLPERSRNRTYFDFDEKIQLNVNAKVGDKVNFNLNYDTEATFDFDTKKIKLQYEGKEDEIIKSIEAGNVSMPASGSLIRGSQALFGVKTTMQFGKLKATAVLSQQESESKTVNAKGGVQTTPFEIKIDQYDENRHFFLAHFFRDNYDKWMSKMPFISSGIVINRVELWVTNKRGNFDTSRNIIGFTDLGENRVIQNPSKWSATSVKEPSNDANNEFAEMQKYAKEQGLRDISKVTQILDPDNILGGRDYEKIESARKLDPSEYTLNNQLGYVSLRTSLQPDEVLAVSYEYTMGGIVYQVGELATDNTTSNQSLFLKLIKSTSFSPDMKIWDLMMKNVYSLNAYQIQPEKFRLDILYQSDTTGTYVNYIPEGKIQNKVLLKVMGLDRLDSKREPYPDGFFDYVEGFTVSAQNGKVFFPVIEPFGSHLKAEIGNDDIARKYVFQELYDSTLTVARQIAEKNKFILKGEYKSSSGAEIRLNAMNVPRGSVKVTAGGAALQENTDYTVDYAMGVVTILNQNIIESGSPVSVSLENQSAYSMQRKTLMGLNLNYEFNENFNIGGTIMNLSEKPLTQKVNMGEESINNTIWGLNTSYRTQFRWLTNAVNKIPFVNATAPSQLTLNAEYAQIKPGHPAELEKQGVSYLDDFESTKIGYSLREYYPWSIASTPYDDSATPLFPEAKNANDIRYGINRSLLSWYQIDGIFTRKNSTLMPSHIKADKDMRSNHFMREVLETEIFPNKQASYGESPILPVLNLAYYPTERGPYNLDNTDINLNGTLKHPEKRWGGMMRKLDITDFEASNIEYIEFWMMDPFVYNDGNPSTDKKGGDLYFNLGEISEDILRDGKKSFENGYPIDGDKSLVDSTVWGKVPRRQSLVYAFDNTAGARAKQDIGFDGLSSEDEKKFPTYKNYLTNLGNILPADSVTKLQADPFSPLNDPASDDYHYYRGADFDNAKVNILNRYKHINGPEGNSSSENAAAKNVPDVEDINQDNTLNEAERYFQYKVSIRPKDTVIGQNYVTDKRRALVTLANGKSEYINWYQFKIPVRDFEKRIGSIRDFKTIRFMRIFMTDFSEETVLRFGTLELVRGEWRTYEKPLNKANAQTISGSLDVAAVNIEENSNRKPVSYVLPPGISRVIDPSQPQLRQLNEQALSLKVSKLNPNDARAVYKNSGIDLRQYKRLQMNAHAEKFTDDITNLNDGDLSVFIRFGADYQNNYYEYEVPLKLTPAGVYSNNSSADRESVWPSANFFDFALQALTDAKLKRNREKREANSTVTYQTPYVTSDPDKPNNRITVTGNPSLSEVKTIMIGVRNNSRELKSGEVWVNELRVNGFDESGGWAANANVNLAISDIANINLSGVTESVGFGGIEQSVNDRRKDDYYQYNFATNVELGRFVPEKVKLKAPFYYSYSEQVSTPKYNPLDQDLLLKDVLNDLRTQEEKDSLKNYTQDVMTVKSMSLTNVKFDIQSKTPMPYDPSNFSFGYAFNENNKHNPTTAWEISQDYRGTFAYTYSPLLKPWEPFSKIKAKSLRVISDLGINYLPNSIGFNSNMMRNYYEMLPRDLNDPTLKVNKDLLSWRKDFLWDRQFNMRWDFTKNIRFDIQTATNARIDEPDVAVNRVLFPDEYEEWKDSVMINLRKLGRPLTYSQMTNLSWTIPLNKIGFLDWTTAETKYSSSYNWDRGAFINDSTEMGNTIRNQMQLSLDSRLNFEQFYNKFNFLKEVNRKFSGGNVRATPNQPNTANKEYKETITLRKDSATLIHHNLNDKNVKVLVRKADNSFFPADYKVIDNNTIRINSKGIQPLNITVVSTPKQESSPSLEIAQYVARGLMSVRSVTIGYKRTTALALPSFKPNIGSSFGQGQEGGVNAPGLDFAFGLTDDSYIQKAMDKGWLLTDSLLISPAVYSKTDELQIRATVEPIRGLKIELNANRETRTNNQIQFMYEGAPNIFGGSFTMTNIAISTSLASVSSKNGYASAAFDQFLKNRYIVAERLEGDYTRTTYPSTGFMAENANKGNPYSKAVGGVNINSPDVLIPAFIAAYTGQDATKVEKTAFPSLKSLLPNWRITFDGLGRLPFLKDNLKSINLSHAYRSVYSVGSYSSYLNWVGSGNGADDMGFIRDVLSGNPMPSSPYDISSVNISESFSPLIGIDATLKNNMSIRADYKDSRNMTLSLSSNQLVETLSSEFSIGLGYKIADFKIFESAGSNKSSFKNDLSLRGDVSYRLNQALIRKISEAFTQPTSGTKNVMIKFSADYAFSKALTLRGFFDKQINTPLVSSTSYPVSNTNFGVSVRFTLTR
ncbi:MAG: cell surface protein SprA [Bacteroidales bacterium]|nr:cell surface protein SprA [Bacteroidales bacterium]